MAGEDEQAHRSRLCEPKRGYDADIRLYPDIPSRRTAALLADAAVIALLVLFAWLGLAVHNAVDKLAVLGEGVRDVGDAVPLVGGSIEDLGERGEDSVHRLANLLGFLTFAVPAVLVLWQYLPDRLAQIRRLTAASRVLETSAAAEHRRLVAMRAAFALPYGQLLRFTRDPLGDLAAERYEPLIAAALDDAGLRGRPRGHEADASD